MKISSLLQDVLKILKIVVLQQFQKVNHCENTGNYNNFCQIMDE